MSTARAIGSPWKRIERFWFRPVSAAGFGAMRMSYGAAAFIVFALQWHNVTRYYADTGLMPHGALSYFLRAEYRFSILDWVTVPAVWWLYLLLLTSLLFVIAGVWTRVALLVSTVLLFSFHEYNPVLLDGGDTTLRLIAFILLISPCDRSFTLTNMLRRMRRVVRHASDQPASERTMPIWPYRLLLWQFICIYLSSAWEKLSGTTWLDGSAAAIVLHHPHFSRVPPAVADLLAHLSPFVTYFVLVAQLSWILLLLLPLLERFVPLPAGMSGTVKRAVLLGGVLMHLGITLFMDVGMFSYVVFAGYVGLLLDEDFRAMREFFNRKTYSIVVLFDGSCGLCRRSVTVLKSLDWLHRLTFADFTDERARLEYAPTITPAELEKAIHVRFSPTTFLKGFAGFRALCPHLPALWVLVPLLWIPGIHIPGEWVYQNIAARRMRCSDGVCRI